jgi:tetratricopeptide (TPR) repeat protein
MMDMKFLTALIIFLGMSLSHANEETSKSAFELGVESYRAKKFEQSVEHFSKAVTTDPNNTVLLTNWGLALSQTGQLGMALGALRRSYAIDPENTVTSQAISFLSKQVRLGDIDRESSMLEFLRSEIFVHIPKGSAWLILSILFSFSGFLWIRHLSQRKKAIKAELAMPGFPTVAVLLSTLWVFFGVALASHEYDLHHPRATVVAKKASVFAGPDESQLLLYEIPEGAEVLVRETQEKWARIQLPGSLTGWSKLENIYRTSGQGVTQ